LFFFNLLVLPALDGSELLSTLLLYLARYPDEEFAPFDIEMEGNHRSRSTRTAVSSFKEQLRRRKGIIERCLRYMTLALCFISLIGVILPA
jgi:membrane-associated protease RseP (regulator of RpoE activity)